MTSKRIGFLGAFSIDNAGDALVGYAGRQALRALWYPTRPRSCSHPRSPSRCGSTRGIASAASTPRSSRSWPTASSKVREFVADLGLEPHYLCPYLPPSPGWSPGWKIEQLILARADVTFARRLAELRARLAAHHARMVSALQLV